MKLLAKQFNSFTQGLFFLVISGFLVWTALQPPWFQNVDVQMTELPHARTFTSTGEGEVTSKPDMAVVNLSVVSQGKTVSDVTKDGNEKMGRVIATMKGLGVDEDDIKTTQYGLNPEYVYPENRKAVIAGYRLNQNVRIKVRDLAKVEQVIDEGVKQGANQVGQLSFEIDDDSEQRKAAREEAFADARAKAEEMASAAGVTIGRVVTFQESGGYEPPIYYGRMEAVSMDMAEAPAPAIEPGSQETKVTVSVTYEIE